MIDGDPFPARLNPAILARVMISLGDVPSTEGHRLAREPIVKSQTNNLGHTEPPPRGADAKAGFGSFDGRPFLPGAKPVFLRLDNPGRLVPDHDQRTSH